MTTRPPKYKPLLFTTTVRTPERLKGMLSVLKNYNNKILTNELAEEIAGELIRIGLYKPTRVNKTVKNKREQGTALSDDEVLDVLQRNPQDHKEAGFDRGWPSRFDTWFKIGKELGFVYYEMNKKIKFSRVGLMLADTDHPELEKQAFLNAFVKYQRHNPFRRVLNKNVPLLLLLKVIRKINNDPDYNNTGITKLEIPLILTWRNDDAEESYQKIKQIRAKYGYQPSWDVILDICDELTEGRHASMPDKTIMVEYPDDFIRKMRLTGLISIKGYGRFIDINKKENKKIDYILKNYSKYKEYKTERDYFKYMSSVDKNLISIDKEYKIDVDEQNRLLIKWKSHYSWQIIKSEMLRLTTSKQASSDDVLRFIPGPLRLEFLTSLAVLSKHPNVKVIPNYVSDDEGLPTSHAPGNNPDIECYEDDRCILLEVTLITGTAQVPREMPPVTRHLKDKLRESKVSISVFIAPKIHRDVYEWTEFEKYKENLQIFPFSIERFLKKLERKNKELYLIIK